MALTYSSTVPVSFAGNSVRINCYKLTSSGNFCPKKFGVVSGRNLDLRRLNAAGLSEIEPDLNEDPHDRWETNGIPEDEFVYGKYDGHKITLREKRKASLILLLIQSTDDAYYAISHCMAVNFGESIAEDYAAVEPPTGFQGLISWLFLPAVATGMYFHVPGEYLYLGAAAFTVVFCVIEMDKPDKPYNFEPQIYNMERGARDKLMSDYNTMDIWDFNEKYGDLWDFTIKPTDITKR